MFIFLETETLVPYSEDKAFHPLVVHTNISLELMALEGICPRYPF